MAAQMREASWSSDECRAACPAASAFRRNAVIRGGLLSLWRVDVDGHCHDCDSGKTHHNRERIGAKGTDDGADE
jgi:hypothetical protein